MQIRIFYPTNCTNTCILNRLYKLIHNKSYLKYYLDMYPNNKINLQSHHHVTKIPKMSASHVYPIKPIQTWEILDEYRNRHFATPRLCDMWRTKSSQLSCLNLKRRVPSGDLPSKSSSASTVRFGRINCSMTQWWIHKQSYVANNDSTVIQICIYNFTPWR